MLFSNIIRKKFDAVLGRYDGAQAWYYFSPADFPDIRAERFDVKGNHGMLRGFFYFYGELSRDSLVIFDHGIGAGHLAYFREIEVLARHGYTVYAYDHTGCVNSDGPGILGFAQGANDLDRVITAIKKDTRFGDTPVKVIGHSWGGYAAMNVAPFHPEVTHVVSLAGFLSARALIEQYLPKFVMKYSAEVMDRERKNNPRFADLDARESMRKSNAALLHLQSRDDQKVKFELCTPLLAEALQGRERTQFITVDSRGHDPQRTDAAAAASAEMQKRMDTLIKKKKLGTESEKRMFRQAQNWDLITQQDPEIWEQILKFLDC